MLATWTSLVIVDSLKWVSRFRFEHNMGARYACFCLFWVWQKKVVYYTNDFPLHYTDLSPICVCACLISRLCLFQFICFLRWTKHKLMLQKVVYLILNRKSLSWIWSFPHIIYIKGLFVSWTLLEISTSAFTTMNK